MNHNKLISGILVSSLLLTSCSLTVTQTGTASVDSTQTVTVPLSVPDEESVRYLLNQSANAMLKVQSYDYVSTNVSKFGGSEVTSTTKATVFPIQGDGWIETTQNGAVNTTYLKNNRMYMIDPSTQSWIFVEMPKSAGSALITVNPKVNDYMTMKKTESGYLLNSIRPLSALEFYMLSGIEGKEMQNLADMVNQGTALDTVVQLELDQDFRYKKVIYDQVTTTGGVSTQSYLEYTYSSYDTAQPVVVPADILSNAVKLDTGTDPTSSTQPIATPDPATSAATAPVNTAAPAQTVPAVSTSSTGASETSPLPTSTP